MLRRALVLSAVLLLTIELPAFGYPVILVHEAMIDVCWKSNLKPLLPKDLPKATEAELNEAQAYVYGGSILQDMGDYLHGSHFFSDLTHYVRSGDFVEAMLRDAQNVNEYAFALGALAHYATDLEGHKLGTNVAEPLLYPKLAGKYGSPMTYEENPLAHIKTEFGFDVVQVAQQRYAPEAYHGFVGFSVSESVLNRDFEETYGLELKKALKEEERAINSYRNAVSKQIPEATPSRGA